jgi:hypothetical protein
MKVYIRYCRPFEDKDDNPPIEEVWSDGDMPEKRLAFDGLTFVYDVNDYKDLTNERIWDGIE